MKDNITHTKQFYENKNKAINSKTKICIKCKAEKSKSSFSTDRKHRDGKYPICHECKKLLQRMLYKKQPEKFYASFLRSSNKYPEKRAARLEVKKSLRSGKITKKNFCELCGVTGVRIEAHHFLGYEEQNVLKVKWLCVPCHKKEDRVRCK